MGDRTESLGRQRARCHAGAYLRNSLETVRRSRLSGRIHDALANDQVLSKKNSQVVAGVLRDLVMLRRAQS